MIFDAKLNSNNDLDFGKNNTVTGLDKVRQQVLVRMKLFRGEWDYDTSIGVPYFQEILGKRNPDLLKIFSLFLTEIEKIPNVTSSTILDFDFNEPTVGENIGNLKNSSQQTKQLSMKIAVNSVYGNIALTHSI